MKTSELTGTALDWAVAKCEVLGLGPRGFVVYYDNNGEPATWQPSTDWAQGGPIIDRERICVIPCADERGRYWAAGFSGPNARWEGTTPLIAAMRCYVASKLGDEVEVPTELTI